MVAAAASSLMAYRALIISGKTASFQRSVQEVRNGEAIAGLEDLRGSIMLYTDPEDSDANPSPYLEEKKQELKEYNVRIQGSPIVSGGIKKEVERGIKDAIERIDIELKPK